MVETPDPTEKYEIFVGRAEDCHVMVDDPLISRHHFVLRNESDKWVCEKLTQVGLVSLNGEINTKFSINEGDEIKCGLYSFIIAGLPNLKRPVIASIPSFQEDIPVSKPEPTSIPVIKEEVNLSTGQIQALEEMEQDSVPVEELSSTVMMDEKIEEKNEEEGFSLSEDLPAETDSMTTDFNSTEDNVSDFGGDLAISTENLPADEEKTSFFKAFVNYQLILFGEHAPYDRYIIENDEIFIGRDPKKCQIVLNDPEVSSVHATIRKTNIDVLLEDKNSSNGTLLNGERINKAHLSPGDEFIIGSTTFTLEVRSDLLEAESERLMPVEEGQVIETEEIEEEVVNLDDMNTEDPLAQEKSPIKRMWKDPKKRKLLIYAGVIVALVVVLGEDETPSPPMKKPPVAKVDQKKDQKPKIQLTKELEEKRNTFYELGVSFFDQNKYSEALTEFQTVFQIDPEYKQVSSYLEQTKQGLKKLQELEAERRAEEERIKVRKQIEEILVKAREAVKNRQVTLAESYFSQITEKDPENIEVQQLKMELDAWKKEEERKAFEKAAKETARKAMVDALTPGKTFYLKKEWYRSILKLEEYLQRKGTDEDLVKEASDMLADAKNQLASEVGPLIGKARSLKEGQDLRNAYQAFQDVLKVEPTNTEALNEIDDIKNTLDSRSKKIYREAIIAESLSLFTDAKEKFLEVQQISPTDSEYYRKATDKLKNYLE
jgi:pSer/pThr/pTyr-binding forkhead associated (FHA) protein